MNIEKILQRDNRVEIEKRFKLHVLLGDQIDIMTDIRHRIKDAAILIDAECPDSREKSLALTKLEEALMWSTTAIARLEEDQDG